MAREGVLPAGHPTDSIVGHCPAIQALRAQIRRLAAFDAVGNPYVPTLLLQGETGTGKGLVARAIHDSGPRAQGPFIEVNCAAIPEALLEAELFGFEAGAFTDAKRAKPGLFEAAHGGTLFLDEVATLPLFLQSKLLNALEAKRIRRLGAVAERPLDVKLITAIHADLGQDVAAGHFRADLYHRLAVVLLELPPLRARGDDILALSRHFLRRYADAHGLPAKRLSSAAEAWLLRYDWPGNVRELSHLIERATLLSAEAIVDPETLERLCLPRPALSPQSKSAPADGEFAPLDEAARIRQALIQAEGNVMRTARLLGLSRSALRHRLRRYGIERQGGPANPRSQDGSDAEDRPDHRAKPIREAGWAQKPVAVLAINVTFPDRECAFKHALTHEVAYGSLLQERRRTLHAHIVESLEAFAGDRAVEHVERLAYHAVQGAVWDKALGYCRQAGTRAASRSAYQQAVGCFEQALAALALLPEHHDTLEQAVDLRCDLRNALWLLGEFGPVFDHLCQAQSLATTLGDQGRLGRVSTYMAAYLWVIGDPDRALESGERALTIAEDLGDVALQVEANYRLGQAYLALGDYRRATDCLGRNVSSLTDHLLHERFSMLGIASVVCRSYLVWCLAKLGEFDEGIARGEEAVSIAEAADHPFSLSNALFAVGFLYLRKGDLRNAVPRLERCLALCRLWNIALWSPRITSALGSAYALSGRVAEALPLLEQAIEQAASEQRLGEQALRVAALSEALLVAGRTDDACQTAQRALDLSRTHREQGHEAWVLRLLGEIAAQRDPPEEEKAKASYRQALALASELRMRPLMAHCHLGLGTLYSKVGQRQQAGAELSTALALYRALDMTFWLSRADAALARVI